MKKILAFILLLTIGISTPAYAAINIPSVNEFGDPVIGNSFQTGANTASQILDSNAPGGSTDLNGVVGCKSGTSGSSVSNSLVNGLAGKLPGGVGSFLNSGNMNAGSIIGQITGDSQIGKILGGILGGSGGGIDLKGILGGTGLDKLFGGSGLDSLFGGSGIDSLLGGTGLGSIMGEDPEVPTISKKELKEAKDINVSTATETNRTCVQNPAVSALSRSMGMDFSTTIINNNETGCHGERCFPINRNVYYQNYSDHIFQELMSDDTFDNLAPYLKNDTKSTLVKERAANNSIEAQTKCPEEAKAEAFYTAKPGKSKLSDKEYMEIYKIMSENPQCSKTGAYYTAADITNATIAVSVHNEENVLLEAGGIIGSTSKCNDVIGEGDQKICLKKENTTPPVVEEDQLKEAVKVPQEQVKQADEVGELVDLLFAQLAQKALTSLGGLVGLSKKSSNGGGSYLDQVGGGTQTTTNVAGQNLLLTDIQASIAVENSYEGVLVSMISDLQKTATAFSNVSACYAKLTGGTGGISAETAHTKAEQASTTVTTILKPQINQRNADIADVENVKAQLVSLGTQASQATSAQELNAITSAYEALISSSALHTSVDIRFLENDRDVSRVALGSITDGANTQLAECKAL